jgi:hypothetical protein
MDQRRARAEGIPLKGNFYWSVMGQPKADQWPWHPIRSGLRGFQDAEAHTQAKCRGFPEAAKLTPSCWPLCS